MKNEKQASIGHTCMDCGRKRRTNHYGWRFCCVCRDWTCFNCSGRHEARMHPTKSMAAGRPIYEEPIAGTPSGATHAWRRATGREER
jgi:hypothetical protein